ncbi:MAG: FAD-dependent oxidoreductase [Gammaproteobacteria bacterium]|nr:FAD-dependent oxidoreductase [Gammaproteobacteria bacterium]
MSKPIIIIGSGLAGYNLAREIRQHDANIPIIMITKDAGAFYSKPMLSTSLSMAKTPEMLMSMNAEKMAAQYNMQILTNTCIEKIIPEDNTLIATGVSNALLSIEYSALVLCTGADTHIPTMEGDASAEILQVNDVYQYQVFREKISGKKNITLLGAGLVGCEFANDLTHAGYEVHIVDPALSPIASLLPERIGKELMQALTQQGAHWHLGHIAKSIHHHGDQYQITLEDNTTFTTDVVFSAIGLKPRIELAQQAHIHTHRGVVVDQYLRTNISNIYAMGDCAEINQWILPYIAPIMQAAKTLAKTLTGDATALSLPAMAVVIKTSCYPLVVCRPPYPIDATWQFEEENGALRGHLRDAQNKLHGFILNKDLIKERMLLASSVEKWL